MIKVTITVKSTDQAEQTLKAIQLLLSGMPLPTGLNQHGPTAQLLSVVAGQLGQGSLEGHSREYLAEERIANNELVSKLEQVTGVVMKEERTRRIGRQQR